MQELSSVSGIMVQQKKEWGEILTGFESKNKYELTDPSGNKIGLAVEEGGSTLLRWFLKAMRPFTIKVTSEDGRELLRVTRPFRFFFHQVEVFDAAGQSLGLIERRFSLLRRIYFVFDASGQEAFELFGPILHPWTFQIRRDGVDYGKITKKWSGLLKEGMSDADNFGVSFPAEWDGRRKALFLGAVFLIDFVHFENSGNG